MKYLLFFNSFCHGEGRHPIVLNGEKLTIEDLVNVSRYRQSVQIDPNALEKVKRSHELLLLGAKHNLPIFEIRESHRSRVSRFQKRSFFP